ncbi:MAG: serine/threonine-protein phosphatase [Anaerolineae bacterium]|nr:serine/threonine-protein phosphatase [Anaerolineae bacterium]
MSDPDKQPGGPADQPRDKRTDDVIALPPPTPPPEHMVTHALPHLENKMARATRRLAFGYSLDIGLVREINEDSVYAFFAGLGSIDEVPDFGIFLVADGAGGHEEGERASAVAARVFASYVHDHVYRAILRPRLPGEEDLSTQRPPVSEVIEQAVRAADEAVRQVVPEGGTTLTAAVVIGSLVYFAHVGDSRAYLLTRETEGGDFSMTRVTRDHSLVHRLEEIGQLTPEQAAHHPDSNRLWMILGMTDTLEPEITTRRLTPDSYLLLCSDGLWNMADEAEMVRIIVEAPSPQVASERLVALANGQGGADNISALVLHMPG